MGLPIIRYEDEHIDELLGQHQYYQAAQQKYKNVDYSIKLATGRIDTSRYRPSGDPYTGGLGGDKYAGLINKYAKLNGIDPNFFAAFIHRESNFNPNAVGEDDKGGKVSYGLAQIHEDNLKKYGVTDKFDPEQSIRAGAQIFKESLGKFDNNYITTLAAYNAGPSKVKVWKDGTYHSKWNPRSAKSEHGIPNFPTTISHIGKVLDSYNTLTGNKYEYKYKELSATRPEKK